ncbi:hypothetical protein ACFLTT_03275 [Chloroflexota bacterium]
MARKKRVQKKSGISEREVIIAVVALVIVVVIVQGISDFFSQNPWAGWLTGIVVLAIIVYAAIRLIRKYT